MPEQEYVYYANWRVISGGYMSISISALLISKPKCGEIVSVGAFLFSTCVFTTLVNVFHIKVRQNRNYFFQADVSSKKRTNKFNFTTVILVFVRFLEEIEDTKKTFRN